MNKDNHPLLPQVTFSIMFALSLKPRHGYEIMQQVEHDSGGRVKLGPGALYGRLKELNEDNFIEEVPSEEAGDRRRYYRLTRKGWDRLGAEMDYYDQTVRLANERRLINHSLGTSIWM
jgi:DNA-binding PadR family transcriptional regulator